MDNFPWTLINTGFDIRKRKERRNKIILYQTKTKQSVPHEAEGQKKQREEDDGQAWNSKNNGDNYVEHSVCPGLFLVLYVHLILITAL